MTKIHSDASYDERRISRGYCFCFHQLNDISSRIVRTSIKQDQLGALFQNTWLTSTTQLTHNCSSQSFKESTQMQQYYYYLKLPSSTHDLIMHEMKLKLPLQMRRFPSLQLPSPLPMIVVILIIFM
ncbi:unnamed protein product [Schistosoma rodhaini]|nr:unnamed protein product [Schistosoma rodhaini]